ncbi:MAG: SPOR domain-containing protein [Sulfurovaceae bacterium]|nr:SPOR domain-containing protein [Sulfurovaceae bacterium]
MKINKKLILLSAISASLLTTGCSTKSIQVNKSDITPYTSYTNIDTIERVEIDTKSAFLSLPKATSSRSSWGDKLSSNSTKLDDCVDSKCVATIGTPSSNSKSDMVVGDESMTPSEDPYFADNSNSTIEYDYGDTPLLEENIKLLSSHDIGVQVGAFRNIGGAKNYAKRYSLMNEQYSVTIQKENQGLESMYRVQLNGFNSEKEAKDFIGKFGTKGAFLVRK